MINQKILSKLLIKIKNFHRLIIQRNNSTRKNKNKIFFF